MRRFIALIIMIFVPLQFALAVAAGVYGHLGTHVHEHEHHHGAGHLSHDVVQLGSMDDAQHNEDSHQGSHCHHVFSFILHQAASLPCLQLSGGPVQHAPAAFLSRIPPLLDRPPLARA